MTCEIINIGDELLIGQVVNTNASWLAEQLTLSGIKVERITTVSDREDAILDALSGVFSRTGIVILTGGLGPTRDDVTKTALCKFFGTTLVHNEGVLRDIEHLFGLRGLKVTELNRRQAEIPALAEPVKNVCGTAPGLWMKKDNKVYISMPGVPFEMKEMTTSYLLPRLMALDPGRVIVQKTILTTGMGESFLAKRIEHWETSLPPSFSLAYLPSPGIVRLRLLAEGNDKAALETELARQISGLVQRIPELIFGYDDDRLGEIVGRQLSQKRLTLATAESCTGGNIAHLLTSVPGSSAYYHGSVVAYANRVKEEVLGVGRPLLDTHGAVSREVVTAMSEGVKQRLNTDCSIATSGVAGPEGGTPEKPVGTTWIAVTTPANTVAKQFMFGEDRMRNITRTSIAALNMLRIELSTL
jgi:nicotinamide-nucleotide amidase